VAFFHKEGLNVDIETNGTLIDHPKAEALRRHEVRNVSVSLDGFHPGTHDRIRGVEGAFGMTLQGLSHLLAHGLNIQVIMSLSMENRDEIEDLARMVQEMGVQSMKINPVLPIGRGRMMHGLNRALNVEELIALAGWIRKTLQPEIGMPVYFCLPAAFQPFEDIIRGGQAECAILNILGIVENGDISFCGIENVEKDLVMGNIKRDRLEDIWFNHPILEDMRASIPERLEGICSQCFFKKRCLGTCRACAYHLEKSLTAPYWFCQEAFDQGLFPETRYLARNS
jgi:SynChlorMet cassette radical SAM/SPASM protein ScmF